MFKLMGKEINAILSAHVKLSLSKPMPNDLNLAEYLFTAPAHLTFMKNLNE